MSELETTLDASMPEAELAVRSALKEQGFGVLTEIDVAATFKEKLGIDRNPLKILGACNPNYAYQALLIDPAVSLLLPCNVVLETTDQGTRVAIADPRQMMPGEKFASLADEAATTLMAVMANIKNASSSST